MSGNRITNRLDKKNKQIFENDTLLIKCLDGTDTRYKVKWSDYREDWFAENPNEIYDLSSNYFNEAIIVEN